jgi:MFS family permease
LFLSFLNRFLEILKWQNLVKTIKIISISEATKQVLAALTLGIFTPVGVGEYAGKALYFDKKSTKKIIFLNLICNGIQIVATVFFGAIGLLILGFGFWVLGLIVAFLIFFLVSLLSKKIKIKGYSIEDFLVRIKEIPKDIQRRNILFGFCRYLVFSHQYYFLFLGFDVNVDYCSMMATITTVYFLASIVPSFQFLDFALKGSLSIYFFGLLGVNEWVVVFVTTLMWFLNIVLPALIGGFYVLNFRLKPISPIE